MAQTMELDGGARAAEREMVSAWRRLGMNWAAIDRNLGQRLGYALRLYGEHTPSPAARRPPMATAEEMAAIEAAERLVAKRADDEACAAAPAARQARQAVAEAEARRPKPPGSREKILGALRGGPKDRAAITETTGLDPRNISELLNKYKRHGYVCLSAKLKWYLTAAGLAALQAEEARRG